MRIYPQFPTILSLDAEVSNSTKAKIFKDAYPDRFFEMFIAEQNMAGAAVGLARRGKIPFVSTFAAFFTRAFDQVRMSRYSDANIKFVGSHAGVSIGQDGPSQMGLEDIAMFRAILEQRGALSERRGFSRPAGRGSGETQRDRIHSNHANGYSDRRWRG